MPKSMSDSSGDGQSTPRVVFLLNVPDAGSSIPIIGTVQPIGGQQVAMTGGPLTAPTPPSSGFIIYWIIQVNTSTGALSVKQTAPIATPLNLANMPAPDAGNIQIFGDQMGSTDTVLSADGATTTVDEA